MITLKIGQSSYHFVPRDEMGANSGRPVTPKGFRSHNLWFGTTLIAETLLQKFAGDRAAGGEVAKLLRKPGGPLVSKPSPATWVPELAALLVSGAIVAIEMTPVQRDVATKSAKVEVALPVPRKPPVADKPMTVEPATFPPLNDADQAKALTVAAAAGAPFCEVCSRP